MHDDMLDKNGNCKTVSFKDIDLIRVEADAIESVDDKYYLVEKLHKYIDIVEAALEMLQDEKQAPKVKQKEKDLLRLQEYMQETRRFLMEYKIPPQGYGLFIKYPSGYEG
jgi:hypothetical protein